MKRRSIFIVVLVALTSSAVLYGGDSPEDGQMKQAAKMIRDGFEKYYHSQKFFLNRGEACELHCYGVDLSAFSGLTFLLKVQPDLLPLKCRLRSFGDTVTH